MNLTVCAITTQKELFQVIPEHGIFTIFKGMLCEDI